MQKKKETMHEKRKKLFNIVVMNWKHASWCLVASDKLHVLDSATKSCSVLYFFCLFAVLLLNKIIFNIEFDSLLPQTARSFALSV